MMYRRLFRVALLYLVVGMAYVFYIELWTQETQETQKGQEEQVVADQQEENIAELAADEALEVLEQLEQSLVGDAEAGTIPQVLSPAQDNIVQEIRVGERFAIKIILSAADDVVVLSYIDQDYLETLDITRVEEEVFFTLRAKKVGKTELIFDRLTKSLQTDYFSYAVTVLEARTVPSVKPAERNLAVKKADEEREKERKIYYLLRSYIRSEDLGAAEQAFSNYGTQLTVEYPYRVNIVTELAELFHKKDFPARAYTLITNEITNNGANLQMEALQRLQFSKGYLERILGNYALAFQTWLEIKQDLSPTSPYYGRVFYELGETLLAQQQYAAAEREYLEYLKYYTAKKNTAPADPVHYFMVLYHLGTIYEMATALRDYHKAYRYYQNAMEHDAKTLQNLDVTYTPYFPQEERRLLPEKVQFIKDHFIDIR